MFRIQKKFKLMILIFVAISTVCSFWFAVSLYNFINISDNAVNIFITYCVMYFFAFGISPIYYEAAVEITYPVPEGIFKVLTHSPVVNIENTCMKHLQNLLYHDCKLKF